MKKRHRQVTLSVVFVAALIAGCASSHQPTTAPPVGPLAQPAAARQTTNSRLAPKADAPSVTGEAGYWVVGVSPKNLGPGHTDLLRKADQSAEQNPAGPDDINNSTDADLNHDGFVTLDEVLALHRAKLTDSQIIDRLQRSGMVFHLTPRTRRYLGDRGIDQRVIDAMLTMNHGSAGPAAGAKAPAGPAIKPSPSGGDGDSRHSI